MDLGSFLADDSLGGSWADEEVDMASIGVQIGSTTAAPVGNSYHPGESDSMSREPRRDFVEHPIPDAPPYRARVANLPYDATEPALARFLEDRLQAHDSIEDVKLPLDQMTGRPKGFAFVTFTERQYLEESLQLSASEFNGRKVFFNVAAPQKQDVFDLDWRSSRGSGLGSGSGPRREREPREEVNLDWGAARSSGPSGGFRGGDRGDRGDRGEREHRPRREEPDLDWGSARGSATLPPRERRPRRDEPEFDWTSARGSGVPSGGEFKEREFRERKPKKDEPEIDWDSARTSAPSLGNRERSNRREHKKTGPEFDWKRGQALEPRARQASAAASKKEEPKEAGPQKSIYDVLAQDDDDDDNDDEEPKQAVQTPAEPTKDTGIEKQVAELSVDGDEWKTVGK